MEEFRLMANLGRVRVGPVARIGSHVVIWIVVLVPTVLELVRGWRPLYSDDATITLRSYQVLSSHPPLLGQYSSISGGSGHILFDPGPLQYVLLAVPTHIDRLQGGLWGSALVCGLVLSVAVEAMWSSRRWLACVLVALAVVDLAWTAPSVFDHQIWNPDFGLIFLLASIVLAYAVAVGSFGWWPVLVFTASVAAQTELFYALVAAGLVVVCPFLGGWHSGRPRRLLWLMIGFGVGLLCWLPSLVQQVFDSPGNLSALVGSRTEASVGITFGLRSLGLVVWPSPLPGSQYSLSSFSISTIESVPVAWGVLVLAVTAAIAWAAWRYGRKDLAALAAIGLVCSVLVVVSFASVPSAHTIALSWLVTMLWVVAYLLALVVVWSAVELVRSHGASESRPRGPAVMQTVHGLRCSGRSAPRDGSRRSLEASVSGLSELRGARPGEQPCADRRSHHPIWGRHNQVLAYANDALLEPSVLHGLSVRASNPLAIDRCRV